MWGDSILKLFKPRIEFIGEKSSRINDMAMNSSPIKYQEFYEEWMKTYKSTFGEFAPTESSSPEEAPKDFMKLVDESNKLYMSWIEEFEKNSKKTAQLLNERVDDAAKYKESFDNWIKSYRTANCSIYPEISLPTITDKDLMKIADESHGLYATSDVNENSDIKHLKDDFESYIKINYLYSDSISKMAKQIKEMHNKLYMPSIESSNKFSEGMTKISKGQAHLDIYNKLYEEYKKKYEKIKIIENLQKELLSELHFEALPEIKKDTSNGIGEEIKKIYYKQQPIKNKKLFISNKKEIFEILKAIKQVEISDMISEIDGKPNLLFSKDLLCELSEYINESKEIENFLNIFLDQFAELKSGFPLEDNTRKFLLNEFVYLIIKMKEL